MRRFDIHILPRIVDGKEYLEYKGKLFSLTENSVKEIIKDIRKDITTLSKQWNDEIKLRSGDT